MTTTTIESRIARQLCKDAIRDRLLAERRAKREARPCDHYGCGPEACGINDTENHLHQNPVLIDQWSHFRTEGTR